MLGNRSEVELACMRLWVFIGKPLGQLRKRDTSAKREGRCGSCAVRCRWRRSLSEPVGWLLSRFRIRLTNGCLLIDWLIKLRLMIRAKLETPFGRTEGVSQRLKVGR